MQKAIFLDKDGTLIEDVPYNVNLDRISLYPETRSSVHQLYATGYSLVIITNQSGVARGYFPETALVTVESYLRVLLGVPIAGFYYCPHHPDGTVLQYAISCDCRKPEPGLLRQAAIDHDIDLSQSWLIGDILNDIEAGHRAGCRTVLIDRGNETEWLLTPARIPDYVAPDLSQAVDFILQQQNHEPSRCSNPTIA